MLSEVLQSVVLGVVQGLGEFLPISSTAHLILVPYFFCWKDLGLAFDVALHIGTLIAVLAYFYSDWIKIFDLAIDNLKLKKAICNNSLSRGRGIMYNRNLLWFLVIATIPGILAGYFLEEKAETIFRSPLLIAFTLAFFGLILYLVDRRVQHKKTLGEITSLDSIIIGLSQAIAIIPGISRSGATITAGLFQKLDRVNAARFSFLLSTPIIFGAAVFKLPHLFREGINIAMAVGVLTSAISGYLAIKYLLKFVQKSSYAIFFWYRLVLSLAIVLVYFLK
ncbi:MAG: undecaprenyl-diphosphate phosphatase [Candidatus Moranbacteria bacterium]|nr:undecaprenyl-diphosphate phosphatase [Candidatus Moranbacteria bacterium]